MKIKSVIVEDSRLARNELKELMKNHQELELLGEAENVDNGYELIQKTSPDLLFLDINMPEKNGFDLLEMLDDVPITVFTTAFDEYAIKSFEYNALDYLLKPISASRFNNCICKIKNRIEEQLEIKEHTRHYSDSQIFIKEGEQCWLIKIKDISLFEIMGNYTRVYFNQENPLVYKSLNQIEQRLPEDLFFRANRQQIINLNHIKEVIPWFHGKFKLILINDHEIEISRRQSQSFKEKLSI
ncbi:LytR/AlgR family response regulator transcription factor [Flavobacteriaceae bacterium M23B6Z8]